MPGQRILFVTHNLALEGAQISQYLLALGLKKRGLKISVFSPCLGPLRERYLSAGIEVKIISPSHNWLKDSVKFLQKFIWLKKKKFDLIYCNTIATAPFLSFKKYLQIPLVWCIRESQREIFKDYAVSENFNLADQVLFDSDATRAVYKEFNKDCFRTIYNGADIAAVAQFCENNSKLELRKKYKIPAEALLILNTGSITERKGQIYLVEAAAQVLEETKDKNLLFYMIGDGAEGQYPEKVSEFIKQKKLSGQVFQLPGTADIYDWYRMGDFFICPSLIESFPLVVIEAMAFKLPIIASEIYGIPEQIEHNISGILVPPRSGAKIALELIKLLKNRDKSKALSDNAYRRVQNFFSLERAENAYLALFSDLCKK